MSGNHDPPIFGQSPARQRGESLARPVVQFWTGGIEAQLNSTRDFVDVLAAGARRAYELQNDVLFWQKKAGCDLDIHRISYRTAWARLRRLIVSLPLRAAPRAAQLSQ